VKTVLITGAAGFLGSHLVDEMLRRGYRVIGYDNLSQGELRNLDDAHLHPAFTFHYGDVCDREGVFKAAGDKLDIVLHLAAFKIPRYGNVSKTLLVNSEGSLNLLRLAAAHGARFVITSTSDVYGKNLRLPFTEESECVLGPPTVSRWAYAASKIFDEHLTFALSEELGFSATVVRIFGSYGPRQHLSWWGGPQSVFIDAVLRNQVIPIHGDGLQTRSFTYVADTVRGIADVAEADCLNREVVNIGNNTEITILGLAELVHSLCDVPWPLQVRMVPYNNIADRPYEDVRRRIPGIEKALRTIGFEARTPLIEGLRKTIEWQRSFVDSVQAVPARQESVASAEAMA
jgi:UDP-glucose 4-epimerase